MAAARSPDAGAPILETPRLRLRRPCEDDHPGFVRMMGDGAHSRFLGGPMAPNQGWRMLMTMIGYWASRGHGMFAIEEKATRRWVGQSGPWRPLDWPVNEFGWMLSADAVGRGYAEEAATAALDWTFANLPWNDVVHSIDRQNFASSRLADRLGAVPSGRLSVPPPYDKFDLVGWRTSRASWLARRGA